MFDRRGVGYNRMKFNTIVAKTHNPIATANSISSASSDVQVTYFPVVVSDSVSSTTTDVMVVFQPKSQASTLTSGDASRVYTPQMTTDIVYGIIALLKADTYVTSVTSTRIYRRKLPTNPTFPAITVSKVDNIRDNITNNNGYAHSRIQVTSWASNSGQDEYLSELVCNALDRKQNSILTYGVGSSFGIVYIVSVKDAGEISDENSEIPLYMMHRDFMIHYDYH